MAPPVTQKHALPTLPPVSGEAGKAVTVRALTGTTDETRTRPRAVSAHTPWPCGPPGHTCRSPRKSGLGLSTYWKAVVVWCTVVVD